KRRHPPTGGYARGDETRAKIVAAALEVFGTYGFAGASTRLLAEKAGVNLPALQYYFDGKAGVDLPCCEHIAQRLGGGPGSYYKGHHTRARERSPISRAFVCSAPRFSRHLR